jgi:hypothetical protein
LLAFGVVEGKDGFLIVATDLDAGVRYLEGVEAVRPPFEGFAAMYAECYGGDGT